MIRKSPQSKAGKFQDFPLATLGIIAANVVLTVVLRHGFDNAARDYGIIPSQFRMGRLITSAFIHDGFLHLSMNMILLYIFGSRLERTVGKLEFGLFYIGACFASSLTHIAIVFASLPPYYATRAVVGASGAVAGVMGLYAVRFHRNMFRVGGVEVSALFLIIIWLVLQLIMGVIALYTDDFLGLRLRHVAYWSHLGGFAFGIITALIANMALQGEREYLINEGRHNEEEGNLLGAAQNYETLIKYDPDNASAHANLARLWAMMDEETQSLPYYRNAIKLYTSQGKEDEALAVNEDMKRHWPHARLSAARRFRLASYMAEVGKYERAIQTFRDIADRDPQSPEAQMSLIKIGHLQLSTLADPSASIATINSFLTRYPKSEWRKLAEEMLERAKDVAFQQSVLFPAGDL